MVLGGRIPRVINGLLQRKKILLYTPFGEHDVYVYDLYTQQLVSQRLRSEKLTRKSIECFRFDEQWTWAIAGDGSIEVLELTAQCIL